MRRDAAEMPTSWHRVDVPLSRRAVGEFIFATCHRFILSLKGTQFLSGLSKLVLLCTDFFSCTVLAMQEDQCHFAGPGVSSHSKVP